MPSRAPELRPDLKKGTHWHWESTRLKLSRIAAIYGLSCHSCRGLRFRVAEECWLDYKDSVFVQLIDEIKEEDDIHASKGENILEPRRTGVSYYVIIARGEEAHKKNSKLDGPISLQWK